MLLSRLRWFSNLQSTLLLDACNSINFIKSNYEIVPCKLARPDPYVHNFFRISSNHHFGQQLATLDNQYFKDLYIDFAPIAIVDFTRQILFIARTGHLRSARHYEDLFSLFNYSSSSRYMVLSIVIQRCNNVATLFSY